MNLSLLCRHAERDIYRELEMLETVGIIGLGNAGSALAGALSAHFTVIGYDVDVACRDALAHSSVDWVDSIEDVAAQAQVVLLSLPHPEISRKVVQSLLAAPGLNKSASLQLIIDTSTITPAVARELAEKCHNAGIGFVDSAIVGGLQALAAGEITFLVGASPKDFGMAEQVLKTVAARIMRLGDAGAGSGAKIVNNAIMHSVMVTLLEAGAMARKLDIPTSALVDILSQPGGLLRPLNHRLGERVLTGNYEGGMSVANARKDSVLALETARDMGVPLFAIQAAHTPYEIADSLGYSKLDYAALAKLWENWCGVEYADAKDAQI